MVIRGRVQEGVVVLDNGIRLPGDFAPLANVDNGAKADREQTLVARWRQVYETVRPIERTPAGSAPDKRCVSADVSQVSHAF